MYQLIPITEINKYLPEAVQQKVSIRARSPGQFLDTYKHIGKKLTSFWIKKRNAFIARTYAAYKIKPTRRRYLSLIMWGFQPH